MATIKVKSFSKEQGFGYIDHPEQGDLFFDFEACNFDPKAGDEVVISEIKERRYPKGTFKALGVSCPAKPPR